MSRIIEPGKKLSSFEKQYLRDRGIDPEAYQNVDPDEETVEDFHDEQAAALADKDRIIGELQQRVVALEAENAVLRQRPRDLTAEPDDLSERDTETDSEPDEEPEGEAVRQPDGETGEGDDEEDVPYTEWTNDELRTELGNRELATDGKKADLVARLEADDAEGDGTDEDNAS